ncbi:MAG: methyltransferase domain-containing protein [Desulfobacterales bacterium]|jgi:hypothetical protein
MIADATGRQAKTIREFLAEGALAALDVGCGLGAKTSFIARHVKGTVGIDPNAGDVREAQNRYGGRHLSFLVARAEMLCFADYRLSRPEAAADGVTKRDIRARFDRCPRHTAGDTLIDYTASVWHLVKK